MTEREEQPRADAEEATTSSELETEGEATAQKRPGPPRRSLLTAAISAGVLLFALAFFMAGFATHALLDEEDSGGAVATGPTPSAADDDPAWGPRDATVTIVEFSDFQCPYCARFHNETLPKIKEAYGDKVRFIYRDFPLQSHEFAQKAAEAGQCAHEQGSFWDYHDLLFANQSALDVADLKRYADQVGLDVGQFTDCLSSNKNSWEVLLDLQDGIRAGVTGTPAFLVNGLLVSGAQPFERFQVVIDQALASAGH